MDEEHKTCVPDLDVLAYDVNAVAVSQSDRYFISCMGFVD